MCVVRKSTLCKQTFEASNYFNYENDATRLFTYAAVITTSAGWYWKVIQFRSDAQRNVDSYLRFSRWMSSKIYIHFSSSGTDRSRRTIFLLRLKLALTRLCSHQAISISIISVISIRTFFFRKYSSLSLLRVFSCLLFRFFWHKTMLSRVSLVADTNYYDIILSL